MMKNLSKNITVIIPVYNGLSVFQDLVSSLVNVYNDVKERMTFLIINDCSTDKGIDFFLINNSFFKRRDVVVLQNEKNLGFIGTVNKALNFSSKDSDIILLNTDTKVFTDFAFDLQSVAYTNGEIGTVTPLTNHGTIASLFSFPTGRAIPDVISESKLAMLISNLNLFPSDYHLPTGIGFALYIKRSVLDKVGFLNPIYGKGYGEECDLCQLAIAAGYKNVLTPNCFVYHKGSESFGSKERLVYIETNSKILSSRFPNYDHDVARYVQEDPLNLTRLVILTQYFLRERRLDIHIPHTEIRVSGAGGTEKHIQWLCEENKDGFSIVLSPAKFKKNYYCIEIICLNFSQKEYLTLSQAKWFLAFYINKAPKVHVHHLMNIADDLKKIITESTGEIIYKVHDFYSICPSINLLTGPDKNRFCQAETDLSKCNKCITDYYSLKDGSVSRHRESFNFFLSRVDRIVLPSEDTHRYFTKIYPGMKSKSFVESHSFEHYRNYLSNNELVSMDPKKIVFLGAIGNHKGAPLAIEVANDLSKAYHVEIWGSIEDSSQRLSTNVPIKAYNSLIELKELFNKEKPLLVILPSVCAETFGYTFYETILMSNSVPIVFPFGNPAHQIKVHGCGIIVSEINKRSLLEAVRSLHTEEKVKEIQEKISTFRKLLMLVKAPTSAESKDSTLLIKWDDTFNLSEKIVVAQRARAEVEEQKTGLKEALKVYLISYPSIFKILRYVYIACKKIKSGFRSS